MNINDILVSIWERERLHAGIEWEKPFSINISPPWRIGVADGLMMIKAIIECTTDSFIVLCFFIFLYHLLLQPLLDNQNSSGWWSERNRNFIHIQYQLALNKPIYRSLLRFGFKSEREIWIYPKESKGYWSVLSFLLLQIKQNQCTLNKWLPQCMKKGKCR